MICPQRKISQDNSLLLGEKCQGEVWPYIISNAEAQGFQGGRYLSCDIVPLQ